MKTSSFGYTSVVMSALFLCVASLHAQSFKKEATKKEPAKKVSFKKVLSQHELDKFHFEQDLARNGGWLGILYLGAGSCSSQRLGSQPWRLGSDHFWITDNGRSSIGPRGWIKATGSWNMQFAYKYPGHPPFRVYRMTYKVVCQATGTGAIWTKASPTRYYTAISKVGRENGHYYLNFSSVSVSAEVQQNVSVLPWSGTADVRVFGDTPIPELSSAWAGH